MTPFTARALQLISSVPRGRVATYGQIAALAGNPRAARQVAWILHSSSHVHNLPWHRIINSRGRISLEPGAGYEEQKQLLIDEGIDFEKDGRVDFETYLWQPEGTSSLFF